ncbi:uncharacterized protein LOC142347905 [Convolutriloba macropyga]|uniref:uncharacterized protein LOC142347905 n=1 Tax=Convolutriloba macropyga TaxID=536237 RepID=UPI003F522C89
MALTFLSHRERLTDLIAGRVTEAVQSSVQLTLEPPVRRKETVNSSEIKGLIMAPLLESSTLKSSVYCLMEQEFKLTLEGGGMPCSLSELVTNYIIPVPTYTMPNDNLSHTRGNFLSHTRALDMIKGTFSFYQLKFKACVRPMSNYQL